MQNEFRKRSWLTTPIKEDIPIGFLVINASLFHSFCINCLLFFEMYYIYKEQAYLAALKAANRLSQSNTIPDKTTWESFPHHVHFPTQQNHFQNDAFAGRKPLLPIQCCFPQTPRDQAFFKLLNTQQHCFQGKGERAEPVQLRSLEKCCPSIQFSQQFCPRL